MQPREARSPTGRPLSTSAPRISAAASDLVLKVTPPRVARDLVVRPRLRLDDPQMRERPVVVVQAPAGYGKTSLLAQWRREHLAHGAVVAWVSAHPTDDAVRLVNAAADDPRRMLTIALTRVSRSEPEASEGQREGR